MITVKLLQEPKQEQDINVLTKAQKVEYVMVLSTFLQPGMTVTKTIIERAQTRIEELLKEI